MRTVLKYLLQISDVQYIDLPKNYKIVHVGEQHGNICVWCEVDRYDDLVETRFDIHGTGHIIMKSDSVHLASVQMNSGFVWHVYHYPS